MSDEVHTTVTSAFTEAQAEKLTGVTVHQLRNWDRSGFFMPSFASADRRVAFSRLYSFRDLVSLRILNTLRNDHNISMQHLKQVKVKLAELSESVWTSTTLYVLRRKVVFNNPDTKSMEEVVSQQGILSIPLEVVTGNMTEAIKRMRERGSDKIGRIEKKKGFQSNRETIAGTRIFVKSIQEFHNAGYSVEQIQKEFPTLSFKDIEAAINYKAVA